MVAPDVYALRPADSSFHFSPKQVKVTVADQPSKNHQFKRFTRRFSAFVRCLGTCQSFSASIVDADGERVPLVLGKIEDNRREIEHSALDPGEYTVEVSSENWCFDQSNNKKTVKVTVAPEDHPAPVPLEIVQKAYRLQLKSEVITDVEILAGGRNVVEKLEPGFNNLCITAGMDLFYHFTIRYLASATCLQKTGSETGFLAQNLDRLLGRDFQGRMLDRKAEQIFKTDTGF